MSNYTTSAASSSAPAGTSTTHTTDGGRLLRFALNLDGVATGGTGLLMLALAGVLDSLLGPSTAMLLGLGAFFVVYGAVVLWIGTRPVINRRAATAVAVVNLLWTVDTLVVVLADLLTLTTLGTVVALGLAAVTACFGALQLIGTRRS